MPPIIRSRGIKIINVDFRFILNNKIKFLAIINVAYQSVFLFYYNFHFKINLDSNLSLPLLNGQNVEIDKPGQRVLVHGVDVRQIGDWEEQDGGMLSDGTVTHTGCINFLLCLLCNLEEQSSKIVRSTWYTNKNSTVIWQCKWKVIPNYLPEI